MGRLLFALEHRIEDGDALAQVTPPGQDGELPPPPMVDDVEEAQSSDSDADDVASENLISSNLDESIASAMTGELKSELNESIPNI